MLQVGQQNHHTALQTLTIVMSTILPRPYIPFQANFILNEIPLKFVTYLVVDAQLIKYFNLVHVYLS